MHAGTSKSRTPEDPRTPPDSPSEDRRATPRLPGDVWPPVQEPGYGSGRELLRHLGAESAIQTTDE